MAITTGSKISVTLNMTTAGYVAQNVWSYNVLELVGTPSASHYGEAWWNHVKVAYRSIAALGWGASFKSVRVLELGSSVGEYGEFSIPAGEQTGTRANPVDADVTPVFLAAGVRLTVPTRVTRPGQKRLPFLTQADQASQDISVAFKALVATMMDTMTANMTLGAPAAGVVLVPSVVGLNSDGTIRASQVVSGYVVADKVTSQLSRKAGSGI